MHGMPRKSPRAPPTSDPHTKRPAAGLHSDGDIARERERGGTELGCWHRQLGKALAVNRLRDKARVQPTPTARGLERRRYLESAGPRIPFSLERDADDGSHPEAPRVRIVPQAHARPPERTPVFSRGRERLESGAQIPERAAVSRGIVVGKNTACRISAHRRKVESGL